MSGGVAMKESVIQIDGLLTAGIYIQSAIGALSMSGSSILVAINAVLLKNAKIDL